MIALTSMLVSSVPTLSFTELSAIVGMAIGIVGMIYTIRRFGGERRAGRIAEEDFYQRMYRDLNDTLLKEVARLKGEVADRDATIARRDAQIAQLRATGKA